MKPVLPYFLTVLMLALSSPTAKAQLFVDTTYTAQQMVNDFFNIMGTCVTATNITYNGSNSSLGFFEGSSSNVGLNAGILLSTGRATDAAAGNAEFLASSPLDNMFTSDTNLLTLLDPGYTINQVTAIEFDIVSGDPELNFQYVFASEEYPEWVGTSFNDVFGFFISGPGYSGTQNIALVPGSSLPVSIDNINDSTSSSLYVNNQLSTDINAIAYDGFTTPLSATATVTPGETYHIKLVVGDAGDIVLDSGVFIGIESLCGGGIIPLAPEFEPEVSGMSASFQNFTNYGTYWHWEFGDGTVSDERHPTHVYANEGTYTVTLKSGNFTGEFEHTETITIGTVGVQPMANNPKPFAINNNAVGNLPLQIKLTDAAQTCQVMLLDLNGRLLHRQNVLGQTNIDLNAFSVGTYVLHVMLNGQTYSEKIVKVQ